MRSSDDILRRVAPQARVAAVDLRLPLVHDRVDTPLRGGTTRAWTDLSLAQVIQAASLVDSRPGSFLLTGGEPLQRADFIEILREVGRVRPAGLGVHCSGKNLSPTVVQRLREVGVQRVHIPFHSARQDAHDWLVGEPGALKTAHRAIRACVAGDLPVVAEVVITRPTMLLLAETVDLLTRLGVRNITLRRLSAAATDGVDFVPLSPRLEALEASLEQAATRALERRARLTLRGLPLCVAPRLQPLFAPPNSELVVTPEGVVEPSSTAEPGCPGCPGLPHCAGAPKDYVARFGWEEFIDPVAAAPRVAESVTDQRRVPTTGPMTFSWRAPHRVRCDTCADTPLDRFVGQSGFASSRAIRNELVQAARYRPSVLRLVGADLLAHPEAPSLIYDALRLFKWVEAAGEASAVVDYSDLDLRRLKDLKRIDVALFGPDAATHDAHCGIPGSFAAMQRGVERLRGQTQISVGAYAILHDARFVAAFADAWQRGAFPGEPRFRLSPRGGSLDELLASARELAPGPARAALLAVLPRCGRRADDLALFDEAAPAATNRNTPQQRIFCGRSLPYEPSAIDPIGVFEFCPEDVGTCESSECPGMALGWQSTARSERWSSSI